MNKVLLLGRLTKDIELKEFGKGKEKGNVCRFSIAVRDGVDADGEQLTQFINCVAWNKSAQLLADYVHKGDQVALEGRITQNDYETEDGEKRYSFQVVVSNVELLPNKAAKADEEEPAPKASGKKYHR